VASTHPHDALFHKVFSQLDNAAGQLRAVLPHQLASRIDWTSLRLEDGHYFDDQLAESQSDLLYSARIDGHLVTIYVLFEHQSSPEPWMPLRLHRYLNRVAERWRADHPEATRLPPMLAVVLAHTEAGWTAAMSMHELFDLPDDLAPLLRPYLPQLRYIVDDLSARSDDELRARAMSALGIMALLFLRHGRDKQGFLDLLRQWADLLRAVWHAQDGREALGILVRYALLANDAATRQNLSDTLVPLLDPAAREVVMTEGERLIQLGEARGQARGRLEGRAEGRVEGRAEGRAEEGRAEGRASALLAIFDARGFRVSRALRKRVTSCTDVATLDRWIARAATADSADKVFDQ
jgi:predicted transposase/invertase (TIGR01784 family)